MSISNEKLLLLAALAYYEKRVVLGSIADGTFSIVTGTNV